MYNSFTLWVGLSRSTLQNACKAGKDPQMPKFHSFLLLSLINRFGKENSQLAKYIRVTRNWSYQKLFCMILSNFCFLCFLVWKSGLQAGTTSIMLKRSQTVTHRPLTTPSSSHAKRSSLLRNTSIAPADQRYVTSARWGHEQTPVRCQKFSPERSAATNASSGDVTSLRMKSASLRRGISVSASGASRDAVANRFKSKSSVFGWWWPKLSYLIWSWNVTKLNIWFFRNSHACWIRPYFRIDFDADFAL